MATTKLATTCDMSVEIDQREEHEPEPHDEVPVGRAHLERRLPARVDAAATNERTRELLGWTPTGPTLLEDIAAGAYALPE